MAIYKNIIWRKDLMMNNIESDINRLEAIRSNLYGKHVRVPCPNLKDGLMLQLERKDRKIFSRILKEIEENKLEVKGDEDGVFKVLDRLWETFGEYQTLNQMVEVFKQIPYHRLTKKNRIDADELTKKITSLEDEMIMTSKHHWWANVHVLRGYGDSLSSFNEMADIIKKTFPKATDSEITLSKVIKSGYCKSFSIAMYSFGSRTRREIKGWDPIKKPEYTYA